MFDLDGVEVSSSSSCIFQKEFPEICEIDWESEFCRKCYNTTGQFEEENILDHSSKYWASSILETETSAHLVVNFRNNYQFSGIFLHLGPGLVPDTIGVVSEKSKFFCIK